MRALFTCNPSAGHFHPLTPIARALVGAGHDVAFAAAREVLTDPSYRRTATRLRDEMAALPGPDHAVALLERLAAEKRPILA